MRFFQTVIATFILSYSLAIGQTYTYYGFPPGYNMNQLRPLKGLSVDSSSNAWIAFKSGLGKFDGTNWTMYDSLNSPLLKNRILSVECNANGVWAGTDTGLFNFNGSTWTWMSTSNSDIPFDNISGIYSDEEDKLFIYSSNGFGTYNGSSWQYYHTGNSGLVNDTVQSICNSETGDLWIGTKHGLSKFDGSSWENFTVSNSSLRDDNIRSLVEDKHNVLFIGTNLFGLYMYDGNEFSNFRDYVSSFYDLPKSIGKLFRLNDGSVLLSTDHKEFYVESNPFHSIIKTGGGIFSDTSFVADIDSMNRIFVQHKTLAGFGLARWDSLEYADVNNIPSGYNDLDINEVRCGMFNNNTFHWDLIGEPRYEVPKGSYSNSIFASGLWVGGMDSSGTLHMAAQTYRQSGSDFWPGPLDTVQATIDSVTSVQFDSIWKVNRHTVDEFITQFDLGNVSNGSYTIPNEILYWPAHGSGNYSRDMAPFVDVNMDGNYNPFDGDYPKIKGDQMLWWVMNDNKSVHQETDGIALGLEIRSSAYAIYCRDIPDSNEAINYTTFYSFDIINRSDTDYHDAYVGLFVDVDLGTYWDDFVGCNVSRDVGFVYNGDNNDEGTYSYGINPPMINVAVLRGPEAEPNDTLDNNHNGVVDEQGEHCMMNHFLYYNGSPNPCLGNPNDAEDFYEYLRTYQRCGIPFTYGGYGNGSGTGATNIPTNYFYSGMPYDTGWTEMNVGISPDDRRFLISSGPFSLRKGETRTVDYAYVFSRDPSAPNGLNTSIAKSFADVERVKRWFETDSFPCNNSSIGINELKKNQLEFSVYPNPAFESLTVNRSNITGTAKLELYDMMGQKIKSYIFPPGRKELKINTGNFTAGIYFLKLTGEDAFSTKKIVVKK